LNTSWVANVACVIECSWLKLLKHHDAATEMSSLSQRERVGVRGYGLSIELNPSPGSHLTMRSDLSLRER
jgi:hypothetical protein